MKNLRLFCLKYILPVLMLLLLLIPVVSYAADAEGGEQQEEGSSESQATELLVYSITVVGGYATDYNGQTVTSAQPGTGLLVRFDASTLPDAYHKLTGWTADDPDVNANISGLSDNFIQIVMPGRDLTVRAVIGEDAEALSSSAEESIKNSESESASISEAESISESESIEESVKISESESIEESKSLEESSRLAELEEMSRQASIAQSEKEAARIDVDGYLIYVYLKGINTPAGFTRANDTRTFDIATESFYSSKFRIYAYYADKDGVGGYYVYDELHNSMIPFVSFNGSDGKSYIVSAPTDASELPKEVIGETRVSLSVPGAQSSSVVPGWNVEDKEGKLVPLLYLAGDDATRSFFAYQETDSGISMIPWKEFRENQKKTEEESSDTETETDTTETETESITMTVLPTPETSAAQDQPGSLLGNYILWIVVAALVVMLLVAAVIIVVQMSRKQDAEEREIDFEEIPEDDDLFAEDDDDFLDQDRFDTAYTQEDNELRPFDFSFEDAFPEEMGVSPHREEIAPEPVEGEIIDPEPFGAEPLDPASDEADSYEEVRVRVRRTEIRDTEVYVKRKTGKDVRNNPESSTPSVYQEVLQDDFEVVDFDSKR